MTLCGGGDYLGQTGLSDTRRTIKNDRSQPIGFDRSPEKFPFSQDMTLTDIFIERSRSHPCGQRRVSHRRIGPLFEKILHIDNLATKSEKSNLELTTDISVRDSP